jgi:gluconolactonase
MDFIYELKLEEKLSPSRNPSIAWFYVFLAALISYFSLLTEQINTKTIAGSIEIRDPKAIGRIFSSGVKVEEIVTGNKWTEGPLLVDDGGSSYLIFSDTIENEIMRWEEGKGLFTVGKSLYLSNSGCAREADCNTLKEPGSNGLVQVWLPPSIASSAVNIVACQHGNRAVSILFENGTRKSLVTHFEGKRLNSPNDLVWSDQGHLYFTDPDYGLIEKDGGNIANKDLDFAGLFLLKNTDVVASIRSGLPSKNLVLLDSSLTSPNGLAFNPRFSRLYVSDSKKGKIFVYDVIEDGTVANGRIFYDGSGDSLVSFDGVKVDSNGHVFAAGRGGVLIFSVVGEVIGSIKLLNSAKASNIAISSDGWMYITASGSVIRIRTLSKPAALAFLSQGKLGF